MAVNPMMDGARGASSAAGRAAGGIDAALNGLAHAAEQVAELNRQPDGAVETGRTQAQALLDLRIYQRQVEACAVVVDTADAVVGFLLDVHA